MIKTYRKKPVEIKAVQWTGENIKECMDFCDGLMPFAEKQGKALILAADGNVLADKNNYIVKGKSGELFVYSPSFFKDFFKKVEGDE